MLPNDRFTIPSRGKRHNPQRAKRAILRQHAAWYRSGAARGAGTYSNRHRSGAARVGVAQGFFRCLRNDRADSSSFGTRSGANSNSWHNTSLSEASFCAYFRRGWNHPSMATKHASTENMTSTARIVKVGSGENPKKRPRGESVHAPRGVRGLSILAATSCFGHRVKPDLAVRLPHAESG